MVEAGREPIDENEVLYRRVPTSTNWYDPVTKTLSDQAFAPHKDNDATGLSVSRQKYATPERAALGRPGKSYYVAVMHASKLLGAGLQIAPMPDTPNGYDPAHAEFPQMNSGNRKSDATQNWQRLLSSECIEAVLGPFETL